MKSATIYILMVSIIRISWDGIYHRVSTRFTSASARFYSTNERDDFALIRDNFIHQWCSMSLYVIYVFGEHFQSNIVHPILLPHSSHASPFHGFFFTNSSSILLRLTKGDAHNP
jgi:hypothetical protein